MEVIKRLRLFIMLVTMGILALVFLGIFLGIAIYLHYSEEREAYSQLSNRELQFGDYNNEDSTVSSPPLHAGWDQTVFEEARSFAVLLDNDNNIIAFDYNTTLFDENTVRTVLEYALSSDADNGKTGNMYYMFRPYENNIALVAVDRSIEISITDRVILLVLILILSALAFLAILIWWLSFYVVQPVANAFKKQERFIADASHELKTPLTIISANASLLESEQEKPNEWVQSIQDQTKRMSDLINEMLELSKLNEKKTNIVNNKFNLSELLNNCVLSFEAVAYESGKKLETNIPANIECYSDEASIKKIVSVLLDNAIKYSNTNGTIKLSLENQNNKNTITVYNTGCNIDENDKNKIFERFYRGDSSRNRSTGGFGLGLAITKSIADNHKWKLTVDCKKSKYTSFSLTF